MPEAAVNQGASTLVTSATLIAPPNAMHSVVLAGLMRSPQEQARLLQSTSAPAGNRSGSSASDAPCHLASPGGRFWLPGVPPPPQAGQVGAWPRLTAVWACVPPAQQASLVQQNVWGKDGGLKPCL